MTVIRPNSVSGINSITAQANEIKIFKSDGTQGGLVIGGANLNATSGISTVAALTVTGNVSVGGTLTYQDVTNIDSVGVVTARAGVHVTGGDLGVGTNNPFNATGYKSITLAGSTGGAIAFREGATTRWEIYGDNSNGIRFYDRTNTAERLRITSNGRVGIDNTTPHRQLVVGDGGDIACFGANGGIYFGTSTGGFRNNGAIARAQQAGYHVSGSQVGDLVMAPEADKDLIFSSGSTNTMYERLRLTTGGNIGINDSGPNFHLDVNGNIALREGQVLTWHDGSGNKAGDIYIDSSDNFVIRNTSSVTERLRIDNNGRLTISGEGLKLNPITSSLYALDGSLSYYATNNGVYLNGAGTSGWLRLNGSGAENNQNAINIFGGGAGAYITMHTSNNERLRITSGGLIDTKGNSIEIGSNGLRIVGTNDVSTHGWNNQPGIYASGNQDFRIHSGSGEVDLYVDGFGQFSQGVKGAFVDANCVGSWTMSANTNYTWNPGTPIPANVWVSMNVFCASMDGDDSDHFDIVVGPNVHSGQTWGTTNAASTPSNDHSIITHLGDSQGVAVGHYGVWHHVVCKADSNGDIVFTLLGSNGGTGVNVRTQGYWMDTGSTSVGG